MPEDASTVLIVDDDPDVRRALGELLETEGYDVVAAANGRAALKRLADGLRPSAIVLDLMMPVMDGWDFRAEQLRNPALSSIPIIVLTAAGFSESTVRTQFGDIEYMMKPPAPDRLLAAIQRASSARAS